MSRLSRGARRPLGPLKFSTVVVLLSLEEGSSMPRSPDRPPCGPCARVPSLTGLSYSGSRFLGASGRRGVCPDRSGSKVTHSRPRDTGRPPSSYSSGSRSRHWLLPAHRCLGDEDFLRNFGEPYR